MKYQWIFFDADETLYSFYAYDGLKAMLARYGLAFSLEDFDAFQAVNKPLWIAYQNKEITAKTLQITRFKALGEKLGKDPLELNQELMAEMALVSKPLEHTLETLNALYGKVKMGIITNGFSALQQKRLENTQTAHFFEQVIVSEEVGVAKPDRQIFEYAFKKIGRDVDKSRILMVGDALSSDIAGAKQAGIDSCWFNPHRSLNQSDIQPDYEIHSMLALLAIASGQVVPKK